ncbi:MAG: hypothetical protein DRJ11_10250 [Candidatus Aminicenantes bacterium]|nr:MAG: hypothetical protein DRJ11_10250 [Candidatus Aminicenantes bacterium]
MMVSPPRRKVKTCLSEETKAARKNLTPLHPLSLERGISSNYILKKNPSVKHSRWVNLIP